MTKSTTYLLGLFILFITSCGSKYEYWDISKFNIDNTVLEDNEEIILLYTSRGPDYNEDLNYYIQIVAFSERTGDTVNILTTFHNEHIIDNEDKIFIFLDKDNIASKMFDMIDIENIEDINLKNFDDIKIKEIKKVARDPDFDYLADNTYPTIIGTVAVKTRD